MAVWIQPGPARFSPNPAGSPPRIQTPRLNQTDLREMLSGCIGLTLLVYQILRVGQLFLVQVHVPLRRCDVRVTQQSAGVFDPLSRQIFVPHSCRARYSTKSRGSPAKSRSREYVRLRFGTVHAFPAGDRKIGPA